jgi:hypothetical protein
MTLGFPSILNAAPSVHMQPYDITLDRTGIASQYSRLCEGLLGALLQRYTSLGEPFATGALRPAHEAIDKGSGYAG